MREIEIGPDGVALTPAMDPSFTGWSAVAHQMAEYRRGVRNAQFRAWLEEQAIGPEIEQIPVIEAGSDSD